MDKQSGGLAGCTISILSMKNILVLINPSAGAERIARLALKVAQQSGSNLLLCNTFELPMAKTLVFAGNDDTQWQQEPVLSVEALTDKLSYERQYRSNRAEHMPQINCLTKTDFNDDKVKKVVVDNQVTMIVTGIRDLLDLKTSDLMQMVNKANCPVFVIPDNTSFSSLDSSAYLTDLRYCDIEVIKFLKAFNSKIFVTHVSASGIPDMEDGYAQSLLSDAVAARLGYNKLFLRNVKGNNRKKTSRQLPKLLLLSFLPLLTRNIMCWSVFCQTQPKPNAPITICLC